MHTHTLSEPARSTKWNLAVVKSADADPSTLWSTAGINDRTEKGRHLELVRGLMRIKQRPVKSPTVKFAACEAADLNQATYA